MSSKKRSVMAGVIALSLMVAGSSFAMMGGGGGHGSSSNRHDSDDHYRNYSNNQSMHIEGEAGRYDRGGTNERRGRAGSDQDMDYRGDYHHDQYDNHMGQNDPHDNPGRRGEYDLHHSGDGFDHDN